MVNELTGWCGHQEAGSRPMESMTGGQVGITTNLKSWIKKEIILDLSCYRSLRLNDDQ